MTVDRDAIAEMSGTELVSLFNKLTGSKVKRFENHSAGVTRVLKALGDQTVALDPVEASAAPVATLTAPVAEKPARKAAKASSKPAPVAPRIAALAAATEVKPPRPGSKRAELLEALQTPKGLSLAEMQKRFAWTARDCADALRLLAKVNGVAVVRGEDARWRVAK